MKGISHATTRAHSCCAWLSPVNIPPSEPQFGYWSMTIFTSMTGIFFAFSSVFTTTVISFVICNNLW